ncbi:MAG: protease pro-enzyme activation domain-containing protein [Thermoplasmata archaeon]
MDKPLKKYLIVGVALLMVFSTMSALYYADNGTQAAAVKNGAIQNDITNYISKGAKVPMTIENFTGIQQNISKYPITPMPGSQSISFLLNFKVSNQTELTNYINQENNPASNYYHHYLTSSAFSPGAEFGPSIAAYDYAINYYTSMGFTVVREYPLAIEFTGTVADVNKAFNTTMVTFNVNGTTKYANYRPLSIPSAIAGSISSIDGLSNLVSFRPDSMIAPFANALSTYLTPLTNPAITTYLSQSEVLNFSRHSFAWADIPKYGLTQFLFPTTMPLLYNATSLISQGYNGKGITIAVVMEQGYNPSDLMTFSSEVFNNPYQLLDRITNYPVNDAKMPGVTYFNSTASGAAEFTLDLEYSSTMAPGAHIDAVYGPDLSTMSLDSVYQELISLNHTPNIVTNSWGGDEDLWYNLYGPSYQNAYTMNELFEVLNSMGATILFSSGDSAGVGSLTSFLTPSFGATSPYVVGVGGVRTVATSSNGEFPTGTVANFTLAPYSSQIASDGFWYPNFGLNVSEASGILSQSYWYTNTSTGVPYAGGQVGLSYWFNQSPYQHGYNIQAIGRQNSVTVSGEADFNETEYFSGMWVFFWGGTSFACPTVAGELADILSYINATTNTSYLGNFDPYIYEIGNFASTFGNSPFYYVENGSNPWAASNQGLGWPNNLKYPANWTKEHSGYTYLTGYGTINAYNFAHDLKKVIDYPYILLNSAHLSVSALDGMTLNSGQNYTFTVVNSSSQVPVPNAYVNITVIGANGTVIGTITAKSNSSGVLSINTTGYGYDTFMIEISSNGKSAYWYVFVNEVLTSGTLKVKVLQSTVMGGFAAYNNIISPNYPGYAPLYPNTVEVLVTLNGNPVSGAYVVAQQKNYTPLYLAINETSTSYRSVGFTNETGIAFVETWNVMDNSIYYVNATYLQLKASTTMNVTPQYTILPVKNAFQREIATYTGLITLPATSPGTSYTVEERVMNYNMTKGEKAEVSIGAYMSYPTFLLKNILPVTTTSSSGYFNLTINSSFAPGLYYINITTIGATIMYYNGFAMINPSSYIPLYITGTVGGVFSPYSPSEMPSLYAGEGWNMSGVILTSYSIFGEQMYINGTMSTGPLYYFDNQLPAVYPVGTNLTTDPQNMLYMTLPIPTTLPLGLNTFTVLFNDTLYGLEYKYTLDFYIISVNSTTMPTSSISINNAVSPYMSSSGVIYYTGNVQFNLSSDESSYVTSTLTIASISSSSLFLTFDTTGLNTFSFNFATLAPGEYNVTYTVINPNGLESQSSVLVHTQRANTVTFEESGLAAGTTWSVTFNGVQHSSTTSTISFTNIPLGNYTYTVSPIAGYRAVPSGTITVSGNSTVQISFIAVPTSFTVTFTESGLAAGTTWSVTFNGVQYTSTTSTIIITGIPAGTYSYTIQNVSGYTAPGTATITVNGNVSVNAVFQKMPSELSTLLPWIIVIILVIVVIAILVAYARKPKNPKVIETPEKENPKQENNP